MRSNDSAAYLAFKKIIIVSEKNKKYNLNISGSLPT